MMDTKEINNLNTMSNYDRTDLEEINNNTMELNESSKTDIKNHNCKSSIDQIRFNDFKSLIKNESENKNRIDCEHDEDEQSQ